MKHQSANVELDYILQCYKLLQTSSEINVSLQILLSGNERCDDDIDDDDADGYMIPMCLPCYAGDKKRQQHCNNKAYNTPVLLQIGLSKKLRWKSPLAYMG